MKLVENTNNSTSMHYLDYVCEREKLLRLDSDYGFALYKILQPDNVLYIHTVFVDAFYRQRGVGSSMANHLHQMAIEKKCQGSVTTISPNGLGSTVSLSAVLKLGYTLHSCEKDLIWLYKPTGVLKNG